AEDLAQGDERFPVAVVAVVVAEQADETRHRTLIRRGDEILDAVAHPPGELFQAPPRAGHADHRHVEQSAAGEIVERRKNLSVAEVSGRAEEHQRIAVSPLHQDFLSTWPPKPSRMAESSLSANSARPRDSKRE